MEAELLAILVVVTVCQSIALFLTISAMNSHKRISARWREVAIHSTEQLSRQSLGLSDVVLIPSNLPKIEGWHSTKEEETKVVE